MNTEDREESEYAGCVGLLVVSIVLLVLSMGMGFWLGSLIR